MSIGFDRAVRDAAVALLILHQRRDISGCLCGWSVLGASYAEHVADALGGAGLLVRDADRKGADRG